MVASASIRVMAIKLTTRPHLDFLRDILLFLNRSKRRKTQRELIFQIDSLSRCRINERCTLSRDFASPCFHQECNFFLMRLTLSVFVLLQLVSPQLTQAYSETRHVHFLQELTSASKCIGVAFVVRTNLDSLWRRANARNVGLRIFYSG